MFGSKQNDGEEEPQQPDFFASLNPTGKTSGNLSFSDLQTSSRQSKSSSQQGQALPLQKMPSEMPKEKPLKLAKKDRSSVDKLAALAAVSKFVAGRLKQLKVFIKPAEGEKDFEESEIRSFFDNIHRHDESCHCCHCEYRSRRGR